MNFSFKKKLSLLILGAFSISFFFAQELKAGCQNRCWVKRTCVESDKGLDCGSWSGPYDCSTVCDSEGAPVDHGGSGNSGDSGTPRDGPGPGSSGANNSTPIQVSINDQCDLVAPPPAGSAGPSERLCTFPQYNPKLDSLPPGPITQFTTLKYGVLSNLLPKPILEAIDKGFSRLFTELDSLQLPLEYKYENINNLSELSRDFTGFIEYSTTSKYPTFAPYTALNTKLPSSPSQRSGKSEIDFPVESFNFTLRLLGIYEDYYRDPNSVDPTQRDALVNYYAEIFLHEVAGHGFGFNDLYTKTDMHSESLLGGTLRIKERRDVDNCLKAAIAYRVKYGGEAYNKDLPCRGKKGNASQFLARINKVLKK